MIISYLVGGVFIAFMLFVLLKGILKSIRNEVGYHQMEEDRKAKGLPYFGQDDEELEKEMYGIDD